MTDNLILPNCKKIGRSISEQALDFVRFVYQDRSFDGMISLATKDADGTLKVVGPVPCSQIVSFVRGMAILPDHDYYISSNLFLNETRSKDTLLAINAIAIDIDCHSKDYSSSESTQRIDALVWRLQNDCFDCGDLPQPHYIVLTGRGVQIWWCVVPAYAKSFSANFSDVEHYFASKIDDLISEFPSELLGFSVDPVASANAAGLFRLPGTTNTHCQKEVETIFFPSQRLNLKDFRDQFLPVGSRSARMKNVGIRFQPYTSDPTKGILVQRLAAIEKLRSIRNAPIGEERRNDYCFVYYVTAKAIYGDAEAYHQTQSFNSGFKIPLTTKELKSSLCSARRKNYKYSSRGIIEKLDISHEEVSKIGLTIPKAKPSVSDQKKERNKQIINLFNQGIHQKEIAESLGIACSTVSTILKSNSDKINTLSAQIQRMLQIGKSPAEISKELNCSIRTVERHRANPSKSHTTACKKCDKNSKNPPIYGLGFKGNGEASAPDDDGTATASAGENRPTKQMPTTNAFSGEINLYEPFIHGEISFDENDALADVDDTDQARIEAAVLGTLLVAEEQDSNLYICNGDMRNQVNGFLQYHAAPGRKWVPLTMQQVSAACNNLCQKGLVIADNSATEGICYFLKHNYTYETKATALLTGLITSHTSCSLTPAEIFGAIQQYEMAVGFILSQEQKGAILLALTNPVAIITGGPGTGKTAIMAALCHVVKNVIPQAHVKLCAPTGKAAVHLSTVTREPATTIHSLISKRISCDFLIIDETSMVDVALLHDTLQMVSKGSHILFVGDADQFPCIGGGYVLRDMLSCKKIPIAKLNQVYRQDEETGIVAYANRIKATSGGFLPPKSCSIDDSIRFINFQEKFEIEQKVIEVAESLKALDYAVADIQILAPTREWSSTLNLRLKSAFNPISAGQSLGDFAVGDHVIYTQNNYAKKLHNGQTGTISSITQKTIAVKYDGQAIRHSKNDLEHLQLAYSITIHKAQGSEYPIVIIPIHESMGRALTRNLIYTAVTRAKEKCIIVGSEQALSGALNRTLLHAHKSLLAERLRDMIK